MKKLILIAYLVIYLNQRRRSYGRKSCFVSSDALEEMISEAQNMPGLIDLMAVYGKLDELMLKSKEYLSVYTPKTISSLSNSSS